MSFGQEGHFPFMKESRWSRNVLQPIKVSKKLKLTFELDIGSTLMRSGFFFSSYFDLGPSLSFTNTESYFILFVIKATYKSGQMFVFNSKLLWQTRPNLFSVLKVLLLFCRWKLWNVLPERFTCGQIVIILLMEKFFL